MILIIGGCPRSGTTLLQELCNSHPDMTVTFEFGCLMAVGKPYSQYKKWVMKRLWRRRDVSVLTDNRGLRARFNSVLFGLRYRHKLHRYRSECIHPPAIEAALREIFPDSSIVGDKYPGYVFRLDRLANTEGLARLIIYRDCRDVISSIKRKLHTDWHGRKFTKRLDTTEKAAKLWIKAVDLMERHSDSLYAIRYEDLIRQPERELEAMGKWLGVDPSGFPIHIVRNTSIGGYKKELSKEDLSIIHEIAGPALERLGYDI